jgi:hypothetical protein
LERRDHLPEHTRKAFAWQVFIADGILTPGITPWLFCTSPFRSRIVRQEQKDIEQGKRNIE